MTNGALNPIVEENLKVGNSYEEWGIDGIGALENQGFATDISVNHGETVHFKIQTDATQYRLEFYRLGYYQNGEGARRIDTLRVGPLPEPVLQPDPQIDPVSGLLSCSLWSESASWSVPIDAVSGIYFAKVVREVIGGVSQAIDSGASHIFFVVRDDERNSELLFQTSDATWQAYNGYGGRSLYTDHATAVSYDRPFHTRRDDDPSGSTRTWVFYSEYPMVRWLEANGYDVSYFTCVDSDRMGETIKNHRGFLSVGHDEYWSGLQRQRVEEARDAGVHLIFASGNEVFYRTTFDDSRRTLTCAKQCPPDLWQATRPENSLTGALFAAQFDGHVNAIDGKSLFAIRVPSEYGRLRFWANTDIATLPPGQALELGQQTLGYEGNKYSDEGNRPDGLFPLSENDFNLDGGVWNFELCLSSGGEFRHSLTLYRNQVSQALVFGAHSVTWSWGLDGHHDRFVIDGDHTHAHYTQLESDPLYIPPDRNLQQTMVNLLADMGAQPDTLQANLVAATASTDTTPPASIITSPADGTQVPHSTLLTVTGNATDNGGGVVGGVEVSTDNGLTWHPALGRESFSYAFVIPDSPGPLTIRSRAVDDSGNLENATAGVSLTVT
jgi:hypothetical protein